MTRQIVLGALVGLVLLTTGATLTRWLLQGPRGLFGGIRLGTDPTERRSEVKRLVDELHKDLTLRVDQLERLMRETEIAHDELVTKYGTMTRRLAARVDRLLDAEGPPDDFARPEEKPTVADFRSSRR